MYVPLAAADVISIAQRLRLALEGDEPLDLGLTTQNDVPGSMRGVAGETSRTIPQGTALIVPTSGSTAAAREVALSAAALKASATATHAHLSGPGRWVLALPLTHIAGVQVVNRSIFAAQAGIDRSLVAMPSGKPFSAAALATALRAALVDEVPVYLSLVPTQLHRVLAALDAEGEARLAAREAANLLAGAAAVLVGGAATPPALLESANAAGIKVVRTYGMSETAGGCVYDGVPLSGVQIQIGDKHSEKHDDAAISADTQTGRISIAGPMLATGYCDGDNQAFGVEAGVRWFKSSDLGSLIQGRLQVFGRVDDVVITGGVNVAPAAVETALAEILADDPKLRAMLALPPETSAVEVCMVGVDDATWGQIVVAVLAPSDVNVQEIPGLPEPLSLRQVTDTVLTHLRAQVAARLGAASAPHRIYLAAKLPRRGIGKLDRQAVTESVLQFRNGMDQG